MHDVLRARLMRKIESLPEDQIYQVLDYIEFLESRYARDLQTESSGLQRFAEKLEDRLRRRTVNPANLREAFQLIAAADRVLSSVSSAGKHIISELNAPAAGRDSESSERRDAASSERLEADSLERLDADSLERLDAESLERLDAGSSEKRDSDSSEREDEEGEEGEGQAPAQG